MVKNTGMETSVPQTDGSLAMRGRSIGHRMSVLVGGTVLLAVMLVTVIFIYKDITTDFASRKHALQATGYVFASAVADHMANHDTQQSLQVLRSISRIPEVTYAAVVDRNGRAVASLGSAVVLNPSELRADISIIEALHSGTYPVAVDVIKSGVLIGKVLLITDVSSLRNQVFEALLTSLSIAVISIGLSFGVARRLQRRITGPIRELTAAMQDIASTRSYDHKVDHQAEGETGLLIDSFNSMISEIRSRDLALERHRQNLEATVERRTAELRHARDAAESANEAKSSFLATMSHEIRTPLNGLMVMAELLAGAGLDQRLQRYAEVIVKSGQSLLTIINDILDLSKIEAGKLALEALPVDPAAVADDVISLFWEKASSTGIDLAARVSPDVPRAIMADPVRLNQILSNLVNNALKFTDHGQVLISLQHQSGLLTMSVTDSGIGIPQKKLDVLFEAFSQADQSITRRFGGTGLGLAICKRLAEAMGGDIGVTSRIGQGSTFRVTIPAIAADTTPRYRSGRPLQVGIAADGLATISALGTALVSSGFAVGTIADDWNGCDVVFATSRRLGALPARHGTRPSVICLGWIGDSDGESAIASGRADDLMILPLRQQDIADMVERIRSDSLRGKSVLDRSARARSTEVSFTGRRVLVADDNPVNREVIIEVLRQLDVQVQVAVNGVEAVEVWKRQKPDLVFMDCSMPEMDGYTATREIRAHEALAITASHTPVVALTAHIAGTDGDTWRNAGMDAYLTKPFTLNQIVACLSVHFEGLPILEPETVMQDHETILDQAVIDEIRNIGGSNALFHRVLELFASRVPQAVDKVNGFASGSDLEQLADAAHALKSMCANIGASRAVAACHDLEAAAREGTGEDTAEMAAAIAREVSLVMREVERLRAA